MPNERAEEPSGAGDKLTELSDPAMMRALSHPARIAIWAYLGLHGPATATQCAEIAGLSPSACSYHLRALARHGFIEEAPSQDGRERPWKVAMLGFSMTAAAGDPPAKRLAQRVLNENVRSVTQDVRASYLERQFEYPLGWQQAPGERTDVMHVTPDELTRVRDQIAGLIAPYRRLEPDERPAGTLPVQITLDFYPWFSPEEARAAAGKEGESHG